MIKINHIKKKQTTMGSVLQHVETQGDKKAVTVCKKLGIIVTLMTHTFTELII